MIEDINKEGLQGWERGMLLQDILSDVNATREEYFAFLKGDTKESVVFSQFNIKKFLKYKAQTTSLPRDNYYWVILQEGDEQYQIAYLNDMGVFDFTTSETYDPEDLHYIDIEPIVRGSENEEE